MGDGGRRGEVNAVSVSDEDVGSVTADAGGSVSGSGWGGKETETQRLEESLQEAHSAVLVEKQPTVFVSEKLIFDAEDPQIREDIIRIIIQYLQVRSLFQLTFICSAFPSITEHDPPFPL